MLRLRLLLLLARERPRDTDNHRLGRLGGQTDRGGRPGTGSLGRRGGVSNTTIVFSFLTWTVLVAVLAEVVLVPAS